MIFKSLHFLLITNLLFLCVFLETAEKMSDAFYLCQIDRFQMRLHEGYMWKLEVIFAFFRVNTPV